MKPSLTAAQAVGAVLAVASVANAQVSPYSIDTPDAIKKTSAQVAWDMLKIYYRGNQTGQILGMLPGPPPVGDYYWWEAGAMWGTLIDYWHFTGDASYNSEIMASMLFQTGDDNNYMPANETKSLGNDDQGFWGMAAMLAAETKFPNPPKDKPQWLALAQAVFNTQASPERHDGTCGGGIRWQIPFANAGYGYKNSIANGCLFNLGARLARYTGNQTYADVANQTFDWIWKIGFIDHNTYAVYDGATVDTGCKEINKAEFSFNNAIYLQGAAFMYNFTEGQPDVQAQWKARIDGLLDHGMRMFFKNGVAYEPACEGAGTCTTDMLSFKGYIHRWYAQAAQVAPYIAPKVLPLLQSSARAAIATCNLVDYGRQCGFNWVGGKSVGTGCGQQMNVLGATSSLLVTQVDGPVTANTGGISEGDPNAGQDPNSFERKPKPLTTADKAGAGIVTFLLIAIAGGVFGWMSFGF